MNEVKRALGSLGAVIVCGLSLGCAGADGDQFDEQTAETAEAIYDASGHWWTNPVSYVASQAGAIPVCLIALSDGTYQPGKLWKGSCSVEYGGGVQTDTWYYLLEDDGKFSWGADAVYGLPPNAVIGDYGGALPGQPNVHVYICEAKKADGRWHPGKWWKDACAIEYGGRAERVKPYGQLNAVRFLTHP